MRWVEVYVAFFICHLVGDYLLQTDWQARNKHRGLGRDPTARRALLTHAFTYTLAFLPALAWLAGEIELAAGAVVLTAAAIGVPHLIQDDGRLISLYLTRVKKCEPASLPAVAAAVDQTFHLVALLLVAVVVAPA